MNNLMKTLFLVALLATFANRLDAQSYSVRWFKIAGGGGAATGGQYSLNGTIGQFDAGGPLTGGQYSVIGGFWAPAVAVQTPGAPLLSIELLPGGVRVFWPVTAAGFVLQKSVALESTMWSPVPAGIYETNATHISITVPPGVDSQFYRLRKP
jgi:hypothetical protein